jgi:hypothetical protein
MNRRRFVGAAAVGAFGISAGCLDDVLDDVTTYSASPAVVSEAAANDAGYVYQGTEEVVESEQVAGEEIEATNHISEYTRTIELPFDIGDNGAEAGVFAVITTPKVSVAGEEFNPISDTDNEELIEQIQTQYDDLSIGGSIGERSVDALDGTVSLETYEGEAALLGEWGIDVLLDIAQPEFGDDHFVILGVYPDERSLPIGSEEDRIDTMVRGLEHGDDVNVEFVEHESDTDE